jgi:hypothetical protein
MASSSIGSSDHCLIDREQLTHEPWALIQQHHAHTERQCTMRAALAAD